MKKFLSMMLIIASLTIIYSCNEEAFIDEHLEIAEGPTLNITVYDEGNLHISGKKLKKSEIVASYWKSSDNSIVYITERTGRYKAMSAGTCTIKLTVIFLINGKETEFTTECEITVDAIEIENIRFNISEKEIEIGEFFTLIEKITPYYATSKNIEWSSSDSTIATVDNEGNVTGISNGECFIYAKTPNEKTAKCKVVVKPISIINELEIEIGEIYPLRESIKTNFEWSTSDSTIATIDNEGNVIGISKGECFIYAIFQNNKVAECKVYVNPVPIQSVELNKTEIKLFANGGTEEIKFNISPINAEINDIKWDIDDETIASISDEGIVTCKKIGTTTGRVIINNEHTAEFTIIGCDIDEFIKIFITGTLMNINGYISGALNISLANKSPEAIFAKKLEILSGGDVLTAKNLETNISANSTIYYSYNPHYIYNPIFKLYYTYNNKEYIAIGNIKSY